MSNETRRETWKRELLMPHEERYCRMRIMDALENGGRSWDGVLTRAAELIRAARRAARLREGEP